MTIAEVRLNRMVSLVAELSRRRDGEQPSATLDELAQLLDTTPEEVQADIRRLTYLYESSDTEWLLSLVLIVEGDRVEGGSGGPFRRPMRLTPDELLVLRLSLGVDGDEIDPLTEEHDRGAAVAPYEPHTGEMGFVDLVLRAIDQQERIELQYTGVEGQEPTVRIVHPYQIVANRGCTYVVGWCELRSAWRRFRVDRILDIRDTKEPFEARGDCPYGRTFDGKGDPLDAVLVRFSDRIARWVSESHSSATRNEDGSVTVAFEAASTEWMVERVLQYGPDAEVLEPASYRRAVQGAVS